MELLQGISDAGSGTYYFIQTAENIPDAFADGASRHAPCELRREASAAQLALRACHGST